MRENNFRISMHPDQFTLINSIDEEIFKRSVWELEYHADILNLMDLDHTAKIQIHGGGVYGDKKQSTERFINRYQKLPKKIRDRLVVENDEKSYSFQDCFKINQMTGIPIVFDYFHHTILNNDEKLTDVLQMQNETWKKRDGIPIIDYSSQEPGERKGKHIESIDLKDFKKFLEQSSGFDFDIMLEIKDKEQSAIQALKICNNKQRLFRR